MSKFTLAVLILVVALGALRSASADSITINESNSTLFDRWMYPFNGTPGERFLAPVFGAIGSYPDFDNRDGQLIIGFDTSSFVPTGQPLSSYNIASVKVRVTHSSGTFIYDPTYDSYLTYSPDGVAPAPQADSDPGRPIELHGVGLRNGYTSLGFGGVSPGPPVFEQGDIYGSPRSVFPLGFGVPNAEGDVSNNVQFGFESNPWAIGQATSGILPGQSVLSGTSSSAGETFEFDLGLTPQVLAYLQNGLANGGLFFAITSLHSAAEMVGGTNPNFYTSDHPSLFALSPQVTIEFAEVPEPTTWALGLTGFGCVAAFGWVRRRRQSQLSAN
ncbi:MAG: PEP-CTERM sorting domain-containing protein [Pirellulales bacterium]|nr:PEP-CTERM sorting domain-containing protein [Pirellulales bacterium]